MRQLRDYQLDASAAVDSALALNVATLVVMATGLGKTVLMSDVAKRWGQKGAVLLLAHRVELLDQAADKFFPDLGYRPQIIQADRPVNWLAIEGGERVIVGSVQTLCRERHLAKLRGYPFSLVMIDEAHHAAARTYRRIVDYLTDINNECRVLGVTATPKRGDKKALGIVFDTVAYQMEASNAIELGWLVEPVEERVIIEGVDFGSIAMKTNEAGEQDFDQAQLERLLIEETPLHAIAGPLLDKSEGKRVLVFTAGVDHAKLVAAILNRHKPDSAMAIDGKTYPPGDPRREEAVKKFRAGELQYLVNFGIFTEGTDIPECDMVCIARPTKSISLLIQMVGRALRPLAGVVDGHTLSDVRKAAIAESQKPLASVLYFIPKAANVKTVTTFDALGGNYDEETIELAKEMAAEQPGGKVREELERAAAYRAFIAEDEARKRIKAEVSYRTEAVGAYSPDSAMDDQDIRRGGASDIQISKLLDLGVTYETAAGYSQRQAWAVIEEIRKKRCTNKQRKTLIRFGENPDVNFATATAILNEIAANGWKRRSVTA